MPIFAPFQGEKLFSLDPMLRDRREKKKKTNSKVCLHLVHYTDCNLWDKAVVRKVNEEKSSRQNFFIFSVY